MTLIVVMIHVLVFSLCAGAAISVLIVVPLMIYVIPYSLWVGSQNVIGKQRDKKGEQFFRSVKNATRLYKAKLSGKEPIF